MPTKKLQNGNGKLPTQKDIAESFKNKKMSKSEREFVEASMKVIEVLKKEKERGFVW